MLFFPSFSPSRTDRDLLLRAPVFVSFGVGRWSAPVTHQDQGMGSFLKEISPRPWQVNLPQKTVGTTPCPTVANSQILWLSLSGGQPPYGSPRPRGVGGEG